MQTYNTYDQLLYTPTLLQPKGINHSHKNRPCVALHHYSILVKNK